MKLYRLKFVLHTPEETDEGKYLAVIPALPGCRAWGDSAAQALENLQAVATAFIESYRDRGDQLPRGVGAALEGRMSERDVKVSKGTPEQSIQATERGTEIRLQGKPISSFSQGSGVVYLVVDCSGSMAGNKLEQAKRGAVKFAEEARIKGYSIGIIKFSTAASSLCDPQMDVALLRSHVQKLAIEGSTNMTAGIELATAKLKGSSFQKF